MNYDQQNRFYNHALKIVVKKGGLFFYDYISENCRDSKESPA